MAVSQDFVSSTDMDDNQDFRSIIPSFLPSFVASSSVSHFFFTLRHQEPKVSGRTEISDSVTAELRAIGF